MGWMKKVLAGLCMLATPFSAGCSTVLCNGVPEAYYVQIKENKKIANTESRETLRAMSFNIAHGRGHKRYYPSDVQDNFIPKSKTELKSNLDAIAKQIRKHDPDMVCLNEIDFDATWSFGVDQVKYIAKRLGYKYGAYGKKWHIRTPVLKVVAGNAVISRYPILRARNRVTKNETTLEEMIGERRVLDTTIDLGSSKVDFMCTHLNSSNHDAREESARYIIRYARQKDNPYILAGDLNSVVSGTPYKRITKLDKRYDRTMAIFERSKRFRIYPAMLRDKGDYSMQKHIDYVMISPHLKFRKYYRDCKKRVSDHCPIVADILK